jgi:hypothetical protein
MNSQAPARDLAVRERPRARLNTMKTKTIEYDGRLRLD